MKKAKRKIKDLPKDINLRGVHFRDPKTKTIGYWYSQWDKGVWYKTAITSNQVFPLFVDNLEEAREFEVIE